MEWQVFVALVIAIPIILLPVVLVWYLNIGGILSAVREARARQATQKKGVKVAAKAE